MFSRFAAIPECDRQTDAYTQTDKWRRHIPPRKSLHSRFMFPLVCNGVVVASQSFFEVCLLPISSQPNWNAVVDCGLLIISNFLEAFGCPLFFAAVLTTFRCRRFGYIPLILSPFGVVAVLVSPFWLSPFWFVAVLTRHLFVTIIPRCCLCGVARMSIDRYKQSVFDGSMRQRLTIGKCAQAY